MRNKGTKLRVGAVFLLAILLAGYVYIQTRGILLGSQLEVLTPINGSSVTEEMVEITGRAKNVTEIDLNGRKILVNEEGYFKETLLLSPGYNILEVSVTDRFGRNEQKHIEVVFDS